MLFEFLAKALDVAKKLFGLSNEDKMEAPHPQAPTPHRGYSPTGMEKAYAKSDLETDSESRKAEGREVTDFKVDYTFSLTPFR